MAIRTVSELYPSRWLVATDLQRPVTVTILCVDVEELRQADGSKEKKLVLTFKSATKRMVCNQTQAKALAAALGDSFADWVNCRVKLSPATASNGKQTISVVEAIRLPEQPPAAPAAGSGPPEPPANGMSDEQAAELWRQGNGK